MALVAIVGRPNVGKSTLFNLLVGRRVSIVEPTAGVTRDRVMLEVELDGRAVELVDTGGIGIIDDEKLGQHIDEQIAVALQSADLILFVVDARDGLTPLDKDVARRLRTLNRPVLLCVNKVDEQHHEVLVPEFLRLGFGDPVRLSAISGFGQTDLVEQLLAKLPDDEDDRHAHRNEGIKVAIVGKRNVGKSTFTNALAQEERVIVSKHAGTTRDAVDVRVERDGQTYIAIDTAGMRKKRKIESAIELFSQARTEESIRRADVCVLLFDVSEPLSQVDKAIASVIETERKPCVIVGNKWDLARKRFVTGEYHEYIQEMLPGLSFSPMVFTSAIEKRGVWNVFEVAKELHEQAQTRVPTAKLNKVIEAAMRQQRPRIKKTVPKLYFATQKGVSPPKIVLQVNKPALFDDSYRRYLMNRLREQCGYSEVPIELVFRERLSQYIPEERKERRERKRKGTGRRRRD